MSYGSARRKPQNRIRPSGRWPKAVTKLLPPVETEAGVAAKNAAPAVFRPIGRSITNHTGILFPVFFWSGAGRAGTLHKTGAPKTPALPAAAFPATGKAFPPFRESEVSAPRSSFCQPNEFDGFVGRCLIGPLIHRTTHSSDHSFIVRMETEECLGSYAPEITNPSFRRKQESTGFTVNEPGISLTISATGFPHSRELRA